MFSSQFVLILQDPSSFCTGPKIFLNIQRSNILRCCSSRVVNVQSSQPKVTTGLIKPLHIFNLELLFNALDSLMCMYVKITNEMHLVGYFHTHVGVLYDRDIIVNVLCFCWSK
jgi:hypothetical protein